MVDMSLERIKQSDTKRRTDLETLRAELDSAKNGQLEKQRRYASEAFYHFGKLPIEIAVSVFTYALEADHAHITTLGRVCREWRRVILATPCLWTTLTLTTKNPTTKAKLWRERCKGHLRTLNIRSGDAKVLWALEELKGTPLGRLQALSLTEVSVSTVQQHLPALSTDIFSQLQSLELNHLPLQTTNHLIFSSPELQLHTLIAQNTPLPWPKLADSCKALVNLSFHGWFDRANLPDFFWLLYCNTDLESFDLTVTEGNCAKYVDFRCPPEPRTLPNIIELRRLSTLTLGGPFVWPSEVIPRLTLPALRSLQLSGCTSRLDTTFQHLVNSGIAASLEELVIDRCALSDPVALESVLQAAVNLKLLHLTYLAKISTVLDALSNTINDGASSNSGGETAALLCPNLTHINFSHCPDVRDGILLRLVKLRNVISQQPTTEHISPEATPRIVSLVVDGCSAVDASILPWLRSHVKYVSCQYATKKQSNWKR